MPKVTVIIATYNSSATLHWAIRSALNQTLSDIEVLVVGDGCTDNTAAVVDALRDPRIKWTNLDRNYGSQSWPNNVGLQQAQSPYIAYLGHDDLWFPSHLSSLMNAISRTGADIAHGAVALVDPGRAPVLTGKPMAANNYYRRFIPPECLMHRRAIVEKIGYWRDPDAVIHGVDFDYQRRAFRAGLRFAASGELSSVKFQSMAWGLHVLRHGPPQAQYFSRIASDVEGLQEELFRAAGLADESDAANWGESVRAIFRPLVEAMGRENWPLLPYYRWRSRREREQRRLRRGMPHADGSMILPPRRRVRYNSEALLDGQER